MRVTVFTFAVKLPKVSTTRTGASFKTGCEWKKVLIKKKILWNLHRDKQ